MILKAFNLSTRTIALILTSLSTYPVFANCGDLSVSLSPTGRTIFWSSLKVISQRGSCVLEKPASLSKITFDQKAVILSANEYVTAEDLRNCGTSILKTRKIPPNIGTLVDINMHSGLFLSLDVIGTSPLAFLATVSRMNSSKSIVNLPGSYIPNLALEKLQEQGFSYDPEIDRPRFSLNGRYVSPNGNIDCTKNAYPGVWDLLEKKRVVISATRTEIQTRCAALFSEAQ